MTLTFALTASTTLTGTGTRPTTGALSTSLSLSVLLGGLLPHFFGSFAWGLSGTCSISTTLSLTLTFALTTFSTGATFATFAGAFSASFTAFAFASTGATGATGLASLTTAASRSLTASGSLSGSIGTKLFNSLAHFIFFKRFTRVARHPYGFIIVWSSVSIVSQDHFIGITSFDSKVITKSGCNVSSNFGKFRFGTHYHKILGNVIILHEHLAIRSHILSNLSE